MRPDRARGRPDERAFTMIELVIAMAILGVLVAIAVPAFLTSSDKASDRRAQTNLRTASKAAWGYVVENPDGFAFDAAEFSELEPTIVWVAGTVASTGEDTVSVADDAGGQELALAVRSTTGTCMYLRVSLVALESQHRADVADCRAADYVDGPNTGW